MKKKPKTPFGLALNHYMELNQVMTGVALAERLQEEFPGCPYHQSDISKYQTGGPDGNVDPPLDFVDKCATLFKLTYQEKFDFYLAALQSSKRVVIETCKLNVIPDTTLRFLTAQVLNMKETVSDEDAKNNIVVYPYGLSIYEAALTNLLKTVKKLIEANSEH